MSEIKDMQEHFERLAQECEAGKQKLARAEADEANYRRQYIEIKETLAKSGIEPISGKDGDEEEQKSLILSLDSWMSDRMDSLKAMKSRAEALMNGQDPNQENTVNPAA